MIKRMLGRLSTPARAFDAHRAQREDPDAFRNSLLFIFLSLLLPDIPHVTSPVAITGNLSSILEKAADMFKFDFSIATFL